MEFGEEDGKVSLRTLLTRCRRSVTFVVPKNRKSFDRLLAGFTMPLGQERAFPAILETQWIGQHKFLRF